MDLRQQRVDPCAGNDSRATRCPGEGKERVPRAEAPVPRPSAKRGKARQGGDTEGIEDVPRPWRSPRKASALLVVRAALVYGPERLPRTTVAPLTDAVCARLLDDTAPSVRAALLDSPPSDAVVRGLDGRSPRSGGAQGAVRGACRRSSGRRSRPTPTWRCGRPPRCGGADGTRPSPRNSCAIRSPPPRRCAAGSSTAPTPSGASPGGRAWRPSWRTRRCPPTSWNGSPATPTWTGAAFTPDR